MIRINSLKKIFRQGAKDITVLSGLDLNVKRGECVIIRGPSGCGKTTLLNIIGCLTRPTDGEVFIADKRISHLPEHFRCQLRRSKIGFVFQQFNLIAGYTAVDNVGIPLAPLGIGESDRRRRALFLLDFLGLADRADFPVNELSGGEQQRVAMARALINAPDIIIADEPISNIDAQTSEKVIDILTRLNREGKTLLISTHDRLLIERLPVTSSHEFNAGRLV